MPILTEDRAQLLIDVIRMMRKDFVGIEGDLSQLTDEEVQEAFNGNFDSDSMPLLESILLEAGYTGWLTDKIGRKFYFENGKRVSRAEMKNRGINPEGMDQVPDAAQAPFQGVKAGKEMSGKAKAGTLSQEDQQAWDNWQKANKADWERVKKSVFAAANGKLTPEILEDYARIVTDPKTTVGVLKQIVRELIEPAGEKKLGYSGKKAQVVDRAIKLLEIVSGQTKGQEEPATRQDPQQQETPQAEPEVAQPEVQAQEPAAEPEPQQAETPQEEVPAVEPATRQDPEVKGFGASPSENYQKPMPPELAEQTKAKDEDGKPVTLYLGSRRKFEGPLELPDSNDGEEGLFLTDSEEIAQDYTDKGQGEVKALHLDTKNPLDLTKTLTPEEQEKLASAYENAGFNKVADKIRKWDENTDPFQKLADYKDNLSNEEVRQVMFDAGYDSLKHKDYDRPVDRPDGSQDYADNYLVFDPSQVYAANAANPNPEPEPQAEEPPAEPMQSFSSDDLDDDITEPEAQQETSSVGADDFLSMSPEGQREALADLSNDQKRDLQKQLNAGKYEDNPAAERAARAIQDTLQVEMDDEDEPAPEPAQTEEPEPEKFDKGEAAELDGEELATDQAVDFKYMTDDEFADAADELKAAGFEQDGDKWVHKDFPEVSFTRKSVTGTADQAKQEFSDKVKQELENPEPPEEPKSKESPEVSEEIDKIATGVARAFNDAGGTDFADFKQANDHDTLKEVAEMFVGRKITDEEYAAAVKQLQLEGSKISDPPATKSKQVAPKKRGRKKKQS